jgi:GntR family transcriptional regulator, galactonate operon transcriptional repressor
MDKPNTKIMRLHQQVVRAIALRIMQPRGADTGNALPTEMELSQELNVSRNVVREAVKVLASKGLVEVRPKTGMRIRPRSDWNLFDPDLLAWQFEVGPDEKFFRDLYDLRSIIEPASAARAALRATHDEIAKLRECYRQMAIAAEDRDAHIRADAQFHATIIAACHNELLEQINSTYWIALESAFRFTTQIQGGMAATLPVHKAILDAISRRDPIGARTAVEQLMVEAVRDINYVMRFNNIRPYSEEEKLINAERR